FVDGEAGNDGSVTATLPPLEIRVTGEDGAVTRYRLGTSGRALGPGQRFAFSSRFEVQGNGVAAVAVSFVESGPWRQTCLWYAVRTLRCCSRRRPLRAGTSNSPRKSPTATIMTFSSFRFSGAPSSLRQT